MNACAALPVSIPLQRPLWRRAADWLFERLHAARSARRVATLAVEPMTLRDALALNDHLLRDIGVSDSLRDEAAARHGIERLAAALAHEDFGQHGRHWYG